MQLILKDTKMLLIKIVGWKQFSNCKHSSQTTFEKLIMLSTYLPKIIVVRIKHRLNYVKRMEKHCEKSLKNNNARIFLNRQKN